MLGLMLYLFTVSPLAWLIAMAWVGGGTLVYYLYVVRRESARRRRTPIVEAKMELTRDFRVLLPVGKPERVEQLAPLAAALAEANNGEVIAMHVEVVPPQLPLSNGLQFTEHAWPPLKRALQIVSEAHVPVHSLMRLGHDAASGIVETARETKADLIIMGWRPKPRTRDRLLGPTLDPLLTEPPSNVMVLRAETLDSPRRILVPMAGGPNAIVALKYALRLAAVWDGQVTALNIVRSTATPTERTAAEAMLREATKEYHDHPRLSYTVASADSPTEGILRTANDYDLIMIGASREGMVGRVLFGDVPEAVANAASAAVIIVKQRVGPVTGWLRRALNGLREHLPSISAEERVEVYKAIRRSARPDADYFVMIGLSAGIASLGLLLNSPAVIIGAMLVAPLMAAIVGLGMGVVMGDLRLLRLAAGATLRGMLLAIVISIVAGWFAFDSTPTAEILSRTQPTLLDLGVALVSGAAGAYALCRKDVSASLPGVAIAAALVPPLAVVGIGISKGNVAVAGGSLLLFLTNLIAISAASAVVFLLFGYRPSAEAERMTVLRRGAIGATILLGVVAVALGALTFDLVQQVRFDQAVRDSVAEQVQLIEPAAEVVEVKINNDNQDIVRLDVTIRSSHSISYQETVDLQKRIAAQLNRTIALVLTVVPVTQLDPFIPPTPTLTPTPTFTPTPGPTSTPTSTLTPAPTLTPLPTSTPTAMPRLTPTPIVSGVIANTNGQGVFVHTSPDGPTFTVWREGTPVILIRGPETAGGFDWLYLRDDTGAEGWVAAPYVDFAK
jgi:uncharacterized hydrophobic protein (TIGR00271 family)